MATRLMMAGLMVFGGWQLSQGIYLKAKAELAQYLLEDAWIQMQGGKASQQPWPWADTSPLVKLHFPALGQQFIVLEGASGRNLAFGPAHMSASVKPGHAGVSVIGGHRDTHFQMLQELMLGDAIHVEHSDGRQQHFTITNIQITDIRKSNILLDSETPTLALVSCYPFDALEAGGPLRYLVIAEKSEPGLVKQYSNEPKMYM